MKNIASVLLLLVSGSVFSQVIIGGAVGTATDNTSVLLDFAAGQNKGIILPYVTARPAGANLSEGTIVLDASDSTKAKVQYYNGLQDWVDLSSGNEANITSHMDIQPSAITDDASAKAIIGANVSSADGVLVLESQTKAMILPMVASTDDIPDPAPGMLVYINKTGAKRLAVFNGAFWTYWKP
ncbi:MAG: hypothetical protein KUL76_08155 [Kaistella sp.]|nr:hypothetical protein [Kaistella sp.]